MSKLILIRHGQSLWNAENKFTGWVDVDLTDQGILEAKKAAELLKALDINIDFTFTSYLKRAIKTLTIILQHNDINIKISPSWEINERHYGSLTGLNKEEIKKKVGIEKFNEYRRSWEISPPNIEKNNNNILLFSPLNAGIPKEKIPLTESLKDTYTRVIPFYEREVEVHLKNNKNVLISAHGNSLRALCKYLFNISNEKINKLEIPTGNPLLIDLDKNQKIGEFYYLDSERKKEIITNQ